MACEDVIIVINETVDNISIVLNETFEVVNIIATNENENITLNVTVSEEVVNLILENVVENIEINIEDVFLKETTIIENGNITKYIAGEILSGQRLVMLQDGKVIYYDPTNENNVGKLVGITNQSAIENEEIEVVGFGFVTNMGNLIANEIYYASENGMLSLNPIMTGIFQRVGIAKDTNNFKIEFSEPLIIN